MRPLTFLKMARATGCFGLIVACSAGCDSGLPANGSQINATIPKEVAAKQNDAFKQYSQQGKSSLPANASPGQRDRMKKR